MLEPFRLRSHNTSYPRIQRRVLTCNSSTLAVSVKDDRSCSFQPQARKDAPRCFACLRSEWAWHQPDYDEVVFRGLEVQPGFFGVNRGRISDVSKCSLVGRNCSRRAGSRGETFGHKAPRRSDQSTGTAMQAFRIVVGIVAWQVVDTS